MRHLRPALLVLLLVGPARGGDRFTGPWDVEALKRPPAFTRGEARNAVREVNYENVPLKGKPTRVFGYYARPKEGDGPFPAMVLIHGGGGKAFDEWARLWAAQGYVALAMDLSGRGPDGKRLPDGGPEQSDEEKFRDFAPGEADRMWTYHAVAAAIRGHSLLASFPEVDKARVGVTGISWGGYLTCIVAGVDDRLNVAVPVYGCGFLAEDSCWLDRFQAMGPERTRRWSDLFDPSRYLPAVTCPILFVNGTNDFAYPLGSYKKSYRLVTNARVYLCITVNMPHGHAEGWNPPEIARFVDVILKGGPPVPIIAKTYFVEEVGIGGMTRPPRIREPKVSASEIRTAMADSRPVTNAQLHYTTDAGPWQKRTWTTIPAQVDGMQIKVKRPPGRPIAAFFTVVDDTGSVSSSPHVVEP